MVSILFSAVFFSFILVLVRFFKVFQLDGLSLRHHYFALLIKASVCFLFIYIYTYVYTDPRKILSQDAGQYFLEAYWLKDVFFKNPSHFLTLMCSYSSPPVLVDTYLSETYHWSINGVNKMSEGQNVIRLHALIAFVARGNVYIHFLAMMFCTYIGSLHITRWIAANSSLPKLVIFYGIMLFPSLLFWGSAILKEPLMILGIGLALRGFFENNGFRKNSMFALSGIVLLLLFKSYVAFLILGIWVLFLLFKRFSFKQNLGITLFALLGLIVLMLIPNRITDKVTSKISRQQFDFINVARGGVHLIGDTSMIWINGFERGDLKFEKDSVYLINDIGALTYPFGKDFAFTEIKLLARNKPWKYVENLDVSQSYFPITPIYGSGKTMLKMIPEAFMNALFRPFPGDSGRVFKYFSNIETFLVMSLLIYSFLKRKKINQKDAALIFAFAIGSFLLLLFIGWTTPVSGAIARYRIPVYLFIVCLSMMALDVKNVCKKIK